MEYRSDSGLCIRSMDENDLDAVMAIENVSFASPWSRESFISDLKRRDAVNLVLEWEGRIAGYLIAWMVADEIHIGNLAVHPDQRRKGFARLLIDTLLSSNPDANWAWLEVRRSNSSARMLYESLRFSEISIRKNYYRTENEDAIVMARDLRNPAD